MSRCPRLKLGQTARAGPLKRTRPNTGQGGIVGSAPHGCIPPIVVTSLTYEGMIQIAVGDATELPLFIRRICRQVAVCVRLRAAA